ncbi:energy transducer TonB [Hymenobacter sp. BT175]|uniref:energy transducer TonB n=1 Tax=Hymenobacter translucens TaxID=2886507 RepID=UPI001D0E7483|nr:energy transducer TonB [Hymenobacter translucens]MCC2546221.1 energy transducer TonB [Hymenobacter translucens]
MRVLFRFYMAAFTGLSHAALAQAPDAAPTEQPAGLPAKRVEYIGADGSRPGAADESSYRVETTFRDSVAGMRRQFYPSGKLRSVHPYAHVRRRILHGPTTTWYESGQQHSRQDYWAGQRHGELLVYYPDHTLRRRYVFEHGKRKEGACFGPDGQPAPYFEYYQEPIYSENGGDIRAAVTAMMRKGIYPEVVRQIGMDATVLITFTINTNGIVEDVRALPAKPGTVLAPAVAEGLKRLQDEGVWLVKHFKTFSPARLDGQPIAVPYTLPIHFSTY